MSDAPSQLTGLINLEGAAVAAVQRLIGSGLIEKAIEEAVTKTVTEQIKGALREYSDFGKQVDKAIGKALALHGELDLPAYNDTILKIIERQVAKGTTAAIERQVAERVKHLLTPAPETIKLSELVEQYVAHLREESRGGCTCSGDEVAFAEVSMRDNGFATLTFAKERKKSDRAYAKRDGQIDLGLYFKFDDKKIAEMYSLSFADGSIENQLFVDRCRGFERSVFQMRAANTLLIVDCDPEDCDLYYGNHAHY